jgi:Leucine-rich repeat (LRR) protein
MLSLASNSLTGSIPSQIGALTTLTVLSLSDNSLTGFIPESLCSDKMYLLSVDEENVTFLY